MFKFVIVFAVILLSFNYLSLAQANSSAYKTRMKTAYTNPQLTVEILLDSAQHYLKIDKDRSFEFLEQAYLLSLKKEFTNKHYLVLCQLGDFYAFYQQPDLAAVNYEKSLKFQQNNSAAYFTYLIKAGNQYLLAKQAHRSLGLYQQFYTNKMDGKNKMILYESVGDAYLELKKSDSAYHFFQKAELLSRKLELQEANTLLKIKMAKALTVKDKAKALELLSEANTQSKHQNNKKIEIEAGVELADYYQENSLNQQEIETRNSNINSLEENRKELESQAVDVDQQKTDEQINLAKSYVRQNKYRQAIDLLDIIDIKSVETKVEQLELKKESAKVRSEAYRKIGNENKALESYQEYVQTLDQLTMQKELDYTNLSELNKKLGDNQWRIAFLEKDKEIYDAEIAMVERDRDLKIQKLKFQRWFIISLIITISLLIFALLMMIQRARIQRRHNMYLDLKSLRTRMNPHFIFNALNSINGFIAKNEELNANKYLVQFSTLMRSILDNSDLDFISLAKEIEILNLYLQLEHMRFADKFSYEIKVGQDLDVENFNIPPMIIQPFIENAIWHGLRYKESGGKLLLSIESEGAFVKILIEDNGIGRQKSKELKTKNQQINKSTGIITTQKRLEIISKIYNRAIRQQISDLQINGEGTRVEIWLPKIK